MRNVLAALILSIALESFGGLTVQARDDGRYVNEPQNAWFDQLASKKGLCCSFADGFSVQDIDWDTQDGHYRVHLYGEWILVPDDAVVTEPNKFGPSVVWPYMDWRARCGSDASCRGRAHRRFLPRLCRRPACRRGR